MTLGKIGNKFEKVDRRGIFEEQTKLVNNPFAYAFSIATLSLMARR